MAATQEEVVKGFTLPRLRLTPCGGQWSYSLPSNVAAPFELSIMVAVLQFNNVGPATTGFPPRLQQSAGPGTQKVFKEALLSSYLAQNPKFFGSLEKYTSAR